MSYKLTIDLFSTWENKPPVPKIQDVVAHVCAIAPTGSGFKLGTMLLQSDCKTFLIIRFHHIWSG